MPGYLRPCAPVAPAAILTGDPKRAMEVAAEVLERPLMSNLSRGLWGYHGHLGDGRALTVQATGIGAPSAAVVMHELHELGVRRAVRIGTCTALVSELTPGTGALVDAAAPGDGVSKALGASGLQRPDPLLKRELRKVAGALPVGAIVVTRDLVHDPAAAQRSREWRSLGAVAVDLATAPLMALAKELGIRFAAALVVAEGAAGERAEDAELDAASLALARAAAQALVGSAQSG